MSFGLKFENMVLNYVYYRLARLGRFARSITITQSGVIILGRRGLKIRLGDDVIPKKMKCLWMNLKQRCFLGEVHRQLLIFNPADFGDRFMFEETLFGRFSYARAKSLLHLSVLQVIEILIIDFFRIP